MFFFTRQHLSKYKLTMKALHLFKNITMHHTSQHFPRYIRYKLQAYSVLYMQIDKCEQEKQKNYYIHRQKKSRPHFKHLFASPWQNKVISFAKKTTNKHI